MVRKCNVYPSEIADHELISIEINVAKPKRNPVYKTSRNMATYNADDFCNNFLDKTETLNGVLRTDDVDKQITIFTEVFNDCLDACAPMTTKQISRPPAPWLTEQLKMDIKSKNETQ